MIENAGRIDLQGILKTVQLNAFLTQRFKFQEMMLNEINAMERKNGSQVYNTSFEIIFRHEGGMWHNSGLSGKKTGSSHRNRLG